jgi:ribosomal protein S16
MIGKLTASKDHFMDMTKQPNFLFIITDQHRADHLGCYGNPLVKTPSIDGLAQAGTRFLRVDLGRVDHWVSQGAQPSERVTDLLKQYRATPAAA